MTFDYEVENDDGEVVATYRVEAKFNEVVPGFFSGRPEKCRPDTGGELDEVTVYLGKENVTAYLTDNLYWKIRDAARDRR
jgi:hypothetical protein